MLGLSIPEVAERSRSARDAATTALIARMSVVPSEARAGLIDALVRALKDAGVWAKLDLLYLAAAHDAQAGRLNWVSSGYTLTAVNAPGFTVDRGYAGDGSTSYLDSGWAPSSGVAFTLNSAALGAWLNAGTDTASDSPAVMGSSQSGNSAYFGARGTTGTIRGRVNQGATSMAGAVATRLGFTALSRTASNLVSGYRGASATGSFATASSGVPGVNLYLGGFNNGGSFTGGHDNRIAAAFAGAGLSGGEVAALHAGLSAYLAGVGGA